MLARRTLVMKMQSARYRFWRGVRMVMIACAVVTMLLGAAVIAMQGLGDQLKRTFQNVSQNMKDS